MEAGETAKVFIVGLSKLALRLFGPSPPEERGGSEPLHVIAGSQPARNRLTRATPQAVCQRAPPLVPWRAPWAWPSSALATSGSRRPRSAGCRRLGSTSACRSDLAKSRQSIGAVAPEREHSNGRAGERAFERQGAGPDADLFANNAPPIPGKAREVIISQ